MVLVSVDFRVEQLDRLLEAAESTATRMSELADASLASGDSLTSRALKSGLSEITPMIHDLRDAMFQAKSGRRGQLDTQSGLYVVLRG